MKKKTHTQKNDNFPLQEKLSVLFFVLKALIVGMARQFSQVATVYVLAQKYEKNCILYTPVLLCKSGV